MPTPCSPPRGLVDIAAELASRMKRGEHDFQCGLVGKPGMGIDRNAAPVVADGDRPRRLRARIRSSSRGPRRPHPSRCRAPRRQGDGAPPRRCRRYTSPAAGAPAPDLREPQCPARSSAWPWKGIWRRYGASEQKMRIGFGQRETQDMVAGPERITRPCVAGSARPTKKGRSEDRPRFGSPFAAMLRRCSRARTRSGAACIRKLGSLPA